MLKSITPKQKIVGGIVGAVAVITCLILLIGLAPNANDIYLKKFANQILSCPTPEDSSIIEHYELLGKLNGNGNGMDFAVVMLLQTSVEVTKDYLMVYYLGYNFAPAKGKSHTVEIVVQQIEQPDFKNPYINNRPLSFQSTMNYSQSRYFAVIIYHGGYFAGLDLRGN